MRRFLTHARIDAFGPIANRVVGPFTPGLNVVFGRNEAGKTTFASFVRGVLFGWDEARGRRNAYKPANAERSGALIFAPRPDESSAASCDEALAQERCELFRARNADGLQGDAALVADIDAETYRTMFFLTSDELRSLRNTTDMTARLLTAGSGTKASPAQVLAALQGRIAEFTSRAAGAKNSLLRIAQEQDDLRSRIAEAEREADRFRKEARELAELEPRRAELVARIAAVNDEIKSLSATRASVSECDEGIVEQSGQLASLSVEAAALPEGPVATGPLASLSAADERNLRDRIEVLSAELEKRKHKADGAKENYDSSRAAYDAYVEAEATDDAGGRHARQRLVQLALSIALPVVFIVAGVALLYAQRRVYANVSTAILGIALILFAVILAIASFFLMFRPNRAASDAEDHKANLRWTMIQDEKRYEAYRDDLKAYEHEVQGQLADMGLAEAASSLSRARRLLDEAAENRSEELALAQRRQALAARVAEAEAALAALREQREKRCRAAGLADDVLVDEIDREIDRRSRKRDELLEVSGKLNERCGELRSELARAKKLHDFDELKLAYAQLQTRRDEAERELARLLIAEHMLEAAIASWESTSQPEVYLRAGRLLSLMTDGQWTQVSLNAEGEIEVSDGIRPALDPIRLSLSTCQQLYLSLRISLLLAADNVGKSLPIIADDILVNFDVVRRRAAATALSELAKSRQLILLTCHEEVVQALKSADGQANVVRL